MNTQADWMIELSNKAADSMAKESTLSAVRWYDLGVTSGGYRHG
jgi:hypothetical protein